MTEGQFIVPFLSEPFEEFANPYFVPEHLHTDDGPRVDL